MNASPLAKALLFTSICFSTFHTTYAQTPLSLEEKEKRKEEREKRFKQLREAAEEGNLVAMVELGNCYYNGTLTDKDRDLAFLWYSKAAQKNSGPAHYYLGNMYLKGHSVEKDERKAYENYRKAAYQGIPEALINAATLADNYAIESEDEKEKEDYYKEARKFTKRLSDKATSLQK